MKHNFSLLLLSVIAVWMVSCKPATVDINEDLKRQTEETFMKAPARSYLYSDGKDLRIIEYAFDKASQTAVRKEINFKQAEKYVGAQSVDYTYAWGEFGKGMFGRYINLTGSTNRVLFYLNDIITDNDLVEMTIAEPRADMADNMIKGLTASGSWGAEDPTYVLQLIWKDSFVVEWKQQGKILIPDTVRKRISLSNVYDTIGIDSCLYYSYAFFNGASNKEAVKKTDIRRNTVIPRDSIEPKLSDPTKNDTMIKYTVIENPVTPLSVENYAFWTIADITTSGADQNLDVLVAEQGKDTIKLAITAYEYDSVLGEGSFNLNNVRYEKQ